MVSFRQGSLQKDFGLACLSPQEIKNINRIKENAGRNFIGMILVPDKNRYFIFLTEIFLLSSAPMLKNRIVNLRAFRKKARRHKKSLRGFLTRLQKNTARGIDGIVTSIEKKVWEEVSCIGCANCCKVMSPTYTAKDIKRIARHLQTTPAEFKRKWLYKDRTGDWMNKSTPCQFLDLATNMCSIYAVRPADCAGFPHLSKRRFREYVHVHQQNVELCPATYRMVERLKESEW